MKLLSHELQKGHSLKQDKYQIEEKLGSGGFGITYKAIYEKKVSIQESYNQFSTTAKIPVAVKELFISGRCVRDTDGATLSIQGMEPKSFNHFKTRFLEEAETLAQLHNLTEVVQVIDHFEENSTAYMVMSFVDGQTISEIVKKDGPLKRNKALEYILQIAHGLSSVHKKGILHRDISPENIIITPNGKAVLIDFGAARAFSSDKTLTQSVILKHGYAPIEQYSERRQRGPYTDIYALAATYWYCVTGEKPISIMDRDRGDNPFFLEGANGKLNAWLEKSTAYEGADRYQSCEEIVNYWSEEIALMKNAVAKNANAKIKEESQEKTRYVKLETPASTTPPSSIHSEPTVFIDSKEPAITNLTNDAGRVPIPSTRPEREKRNSNKILWWSLAGVIFLIGASIAGFFGYQSYTVNQILEKGWVHYKNNEYQPALDQYKLAAEYQSGKALYYLGHMYYYGRGVEKDLKKGREFSQKAIDQGYDVAAFDLGWAYYYGQGVPVDTMKGTKYFAQGLDMTIAEADKGDPEVQNLLGIYYDYGFAVEKDTLQAFQLFKKAANQGHQAAMTNLASCYRNGSGTDKDFDKALKWYEKSANAGWPRGMEGLGEMYLYGIGVENNDTTAFNHYKKAADLNFASSQSVLGYLYSSGRGVKKDPDEALWWYRKAAEQDYTSAQNTLGTKYHDGEGVPVNYEEAKKWYLLAAEKKDSYAQGNLGRLYDDKKIFNDKKEAEKWFRLAAENGGATGINNLAKYYNNNIAGLKKEDTEASTWYLKAAKNRQAFAQNAIAKVYETGNEKFPKNDSLAANWYLAAAKMGLKSPMWKIAKFYKNGTGVEKNAYEANRWRVNAKYGGKSFTIPCKVEGQPGKTSFSIILLERSAKGKGPIEEEKDRLKKDHNAEIPAQVVTSFNKLYALAKKNNVSFVELAVYALKEANKK